MVRPIDQRHVDVGAPQLLSGGQTTEAAADDGDAAPPAALVSVGTSGVSLALPDPKALERGVAVVHLRRRLADHLDLAHRVLEVRAPENHPDWATAFGSAVASPPSASEVVGRRAVNHSDSSAASATAPSDSRSASSCASP